MAPTLQTRDINFNAGSLAWIIVLPICFAIGVIIMTWTVVRRWKRDDKDPPIIMYPYVSEPGMTLEERVRRIHAAREEAETAKRLGLSSTGAHGGTVVTQPPVYSAAGRGEGEAEGLPEYAPAPAPATAAAENATAPVTENATATAPVEMETSAATVPAHATETAHGGAVQHGTETKAAL